MTSYTELPEGLAELLIEGAEDELGPGVRAMQEKLRQSHCPRCGGSIRGQVFTEAPYSSASPLPRMSAKCLDCGFEQMLDSGLVVNNGNLAKVKEVLPLVGQDD